MQFSPKYSMQEQLTINSQGFQRKDRKTERVWQTVGLTERSQERQSEQLGHHFLEPTSLADQ